MPRLCPRLSLSGLAASLAVLVTACTLDPAGVNDGDDPSRPDGPLAADASITRDAPAAPDAPVLPPEVAAALDLPAMPYPYDDALPAHFANARRQDNTPTGNPITSAGATLGRVLFYDRALSRSGTVACASCHHQANGFADPTRFSTGFAGGQTTRNAMTIVDARYYLPGTFFWDERAASLEAQVLMPIQNPVEMGLTLDELVANVSARAYYPYLFQQAFGDTVVTSDRIARALAQFVRAAVSYRSRYDAGIEAAGDIARTFPNFTASEARGKALFLGRARCATCHLDAPPAPGPRPNQAIFLIDRAVNNGLDATTTVADVGVGGITGVATDLGRFKSPSLRNVAVTAPYMHDGRLATLDDVIDHYSTGIQAHPNLDPRLRVPGTGAPIRLDLSATEHADLKAFLGTLTDDALLADVRFADPFRAP